MANYGPVTKLAKTSDVVTIRSATESDAEQVLSLAKSVFGEEIYQLTSSQEFKMTLEEEKVWIKSSLEKPLTIILIAVIDNKVTGVLDFSSGHRNRIAHTGEFGMSVAKPYRNQGVGSLLLESLFDWAKATNQIEKINLQVHANNESAIQVYKKMGFLIEGVRKKELKYSDSEYIDSILMAKFV